MNVFRHFCVCAALAAILASGCGSPHGQPDKGSEVLAPNEVMDFGTLYAENCAGCHGAEGRGGAAIARTERTPRSSIVPRRTSRPLRTA